MIRNKGMQYFKKRLMNLMDFKLNLEKSLKKDELLSKFYGSIGNYNLKKFNLIVVKFYFI